MGCWAVSRSKPWWWWSGHFDQEVCTYIHVIYRTAQSLFDVFCLFSWFNLWVFSGKLNWGHVARGEFDGRGNDVFNVWSTNREIKNKDLVVWYNMDFHHIPYQEDFPVMPTLSAGFAFRPSNFFDRNTILGMKP